MNWKATAALSGATLVATWLGYVPASNDAPGRAPAVTGDARQRETSGPDIQVEANRLQARVRAEREFHDPARNPFRFAPRSQPATPASAQPSPAPGPPAPFSELRPYTVAGIATTTLDGQLSRTAIVSTASDVMFLHAGDHLAGYTVTRVDEDGVQLAGPDGEVRLALVRP